MQGPWSPVPGTGRFTLFEFLWWTLAALNKPLKYLSALERSAGLYPQLFMLLTAANRKTEVSVSLSNLIKLHHLYRY